MSEKTAEQIEQERLDAEAAAAADKDKKKKVKFDADQTLVVNELYNQAFGAGAAKAEAEWQKKLADEKAALEKKLADEKAALEKQIADLKAGAGNKEPKQEPPVQQPSIEDNPVLKALQAQMTEMKGIFDTVKSERDQLKKQVEQSQAERRKSRKKDSFLNAMRDANISFFDPVEAYELAEREGLEYDEDRDTVFVKNAATGAAKLNSEGEPMNAVDFVKEFASRKKYLVKAGSQDGGLGHHETEEVKTKPAVKDFSKLTAAEFEAERQKVLAQPRER